MTVLLAALLLTTPVAPVAPPRQTQEIAPEANREARSEAPPEAPDTPSSTLPWKLDRSYKYIWLQKKEKIGETTFRLRRDTRTGDAQTAAGGSGRRAEYVLSSRRRLETDGRIQESEGTLRLLADGHAVSFREETSYRMAATGTFKGQQELKVRFEKTKATANYVNNRNFKSPSKHEIPLAKNGVTYLFASHCIEQWNLFTPTLARPKKTKITVVYPEFAKLLTLDLQPAKGAERLKIGDKNITTTRYDFRGKPWKWNGSIWVDARGRMLRYESGELVLQLTAVPD